LTVRQVRHKG